MDWIRLSITWAGMATHSCLSAWNNSHTVAGAFTLPRTRLSNLFPVCLFGFKSGDMEGQGRIFDIIIGEELCDVAWCLGSGIVMLKYSAIQHLTHKKTQQNYVCFCFWTLYFFHFEWKSKNLFCGFVAVVVLCVDSAITWCGLCVKELILQTSDFVPPNLFFFFFRILIHAVGLGSWMLLVAKAAFTSCVAMVALQMYLGIPSQLANSHY